MTYLINTAANASSLSKDIDVSSEIANEIESLYLENDSEIEFTDEEIEELSIIGYPCALCLKLMNKLVSKIPKGSSKVSLILF